MDLQAKPGQSVEVTVTKAVTRAAAEKTLKRLFMADPEFRAPYDARRSNMSHKPKRRGGRIYTKYVRKPQPVIEVGSKANVPATPQHVKDLKSVETFISVA